MPQTKPLMTSAKSKWLSPTALLMAMAAVMQLSFAPWMNLNDNFAVDVLSFSGREQGIQQSIREIPGFLSFAAVFLLLFGREQTWAYISLLVLGGAAALTGFFPTFTGFLILTFISSVGFHYYETMHQSLSLQWLPKKSAPATLGKILSVGLFAQLIAILFVLLVSTWFGMNVKNEETGNLAGFKALYLWTGIACVVCTLLMWKLFPIFNDGVPQNKKLVLRKRYWLYYALTFIGGARRQIFFVFAGFLLIEKFDLTVPGKMALVIANIVFLMMVAPLIGKLIVKIGERRVLIIEYIGLIFVFTAYAFVDSWEVAVVLYILDHAFFAMAIAMKTYFQKIADPADIAPTAGVAFTINHIAAVFIPVLFGLMWLYSPALVFLSGAALACVSLVLSLLIPHHPEAGKEFVWKTEP